MWGLLFWQVLYHEFACRDGQLLSEATAKARRRHPVLVYGFTAVTVAHLMDWLPEKFDPYVVVGFRIIKTLKGNNV